MSESEIIRLSKFNIKEDPEKLESWRETNSPENIPNNFLVGLIKGYLVKRHEQFIEESIKIVQKTIKGDSPHDHVNEKELVSGIARAEIRGDTVEFNFGVFCGSSMDGYVFDSLEVVVENFDKK